jgi:hypothetical protein
MVVNRARDLASTAVAMESKGGFRSARQKTGRADMISFRSYQAGTLAKCLLSSECG